MKELIIIAAGNVGGFLTLNQDLFQENYKVIGFLDDDQQKIGKRFWSIPVLGRISEIDKYSGSSIAVGISIPIAKKKILERIGNDHHFPSFIGKNAWISNKVKIGKGVIIYPNVSVNHQSIIDDFVVINMNCAIGHDCQIMPGSALAPGVNLGGFTRVGQFADIGIGASTIQQIKIGEGAIIGGQTMLLSDVEPYSTYVGVPGRKL